ncbi:MAG: helix-hairpin-helix domain-containing protein [Bacteroidales bacterium]|nr:helix-hairpin-helix domain-containing protein [Bacteroidales bacterium]MCB9000259.1 helix-hairpin-helix domain-containing protein [Bacteroidales bacterium]
MRKFLREFFSFSSSEYRVVLFLLFLILVATGVRIFIPRPSFRLILSSEDSLRIDSFIQSLQTLDDKKFSKMDQTAEFSQKFQPRKFMPDTITVLQLEEMGFPVYVARNIVGYRNAGGNFHKPEDIQKIYGFSDSLYRVWEDYIEFQKADIPDSSSKRIKEFKILDLNTADSAEFLSVRGIGPFYAGQIIQYRERLGGFYSADQLLELWGMDTVKLALIKSQISIDTSKIKRINLNSATLKEMESHPYLNTRQAKAIIQYRTFTGKIVSADELLKNNLLTEEEFRRVEGYFGFK